MDETASTATGSLPAGRLVFGGAAIFDGTGAPAAEGDVAVEDGRIVEVGVGLDGDERIDLAGKGLLPGLIDCHVHVVHSPGPRHELLTTPFSYRFFRAVRNLEDTLACGITTARDAAGADLGVKRALADGLLRGPRLQIAVRLVSQTGGHGDEYQLCGAAPGLAFPSYPGVPDAVVDGPVDARRVVRELVRSGADWIKVATTGGFSSPVSDPSRPQLRPDELAEIAAEAEAAGRFVMAHAQGLAGVKNALGAGFRSVEHGVWLDDEAISRMVEQGTWLVPTLLVPVWSRENGRPQPKFDLDATIEAHGSSFRRAAEAGVRIAMGTDCGIVPHGANLRELELMSERGLTPAQALVAATSSAAELLGLSGEVGTIAPGRRADLVVVDGDPVDVVGLRERIAAVYQDGVLVSGRAAR
jgi:imidazolonepropionase-like amidohydrolase